MSQRRHDMRQADAVRSLDQHDIAGTDHVPQPRGSGRVGGHMLVIDAPLKRAEEHTSELQSLMRISYAVFCLNKKIICAERLHEAAAAPAEEIGWPEHSLCIEQPTDRNSTP